MLAYKSKMKLLPGSNYKEVSSQARDVFRHSSNKTKRKFYIRSQYFKKQKVFFDYFWDHLLEKRQVDRTRRLKLLLCAFDLIRNSTYQPEIKQSPKNSKELLYRFSGQTLGNQIFIVQIKKRLDRESLQCISIFPVK